MRVIKNIRLKNYDYSSNGFYFVTICTNYRQLYLIGKSKNIVAQFIKQLPGKIQGIKVDCYEVMPTHLHLIVILDGCKLKLEEIVRRLKAATSHLINQESIKSLINKVTTNATTNKKSVVARFIGPKGNVNLWQPGYYEHVIRNEKALFKIREYIRNNPDVEKIEFEQFYENVVA